MKKRFSFLAFMSAFLVAACLMAGCGTKGTEGETTEATTEEATIETPTVELTWQTHNTKPQDLRKKMEFAEYEGVSYEFGEGVFDDATKNSYVAELSKFLKLATETLGVTIPEKMVIYVEASLDPYSVVGNVQVNDEDLGTTHFFTQVLMGLTGEKVNYGDVFGLADYLATKANVSFYKPEVATADEVKAFLTGEDKAYFMDFTLPLFEGRYVAEEESKVVAKIATNFYRFLIEKEGVEKTVKRYQTNFDAEYDQVEVDAKNEWLMSFGIEGFFYAPFFLQAYKHTYTDRVKYPYEFDAYLTMWHFQTEDVTQETYVGMVNGYVDLFRNMKNDMDSAIAWFQEYINGAIAPVDVYTEFYTDDKTAENAGAVYINAYKRIVLYHDWLESKYSLLHEYCHYLTIACNLNDLSIVLYEGMAEYLSEIVCKNMMAREFYVEYYGDRLDSLPGLKDENGEFKLDVYHIYTAYKYYSGVYDGQQYLQITGSLNPGRKSSDEILPSELTYADATGFTTWLFETYGKAEILTHSATFEDLSAFTGKDFRTMFKEYGAWITEKAKELVPELVK